MEHTSEDCQCEGKKCTKCPEVRCVGYYTKDKRLKSGLKSQCRICVNRQNKDWRENNGEHILEKHRAYNKANADKISQRDKLYRQGRKERTSMLARLRRAKGRDERLRKREENKMQKAPIIAARRHRRKLQYYQENREKILLRRKEQRRHSGEILSKRWEAYYGRNRDYLNKQSMNWRKENPERWAAIQSARRTRKTKAGGSYTVQEWEALKARYNHACLSCGRKEPEIKLTADHIIPVFKGGSSYIDNIQPLCKSCNSSKGTKVIDFRPQNP
jgi:5-methylcytosine-specific restriction endonuclease McrA